MNAYNRAAEENYIVHSASVQQCQSHLQLDLHEVGWHFLIPSEIVEHVKACSRSSVLICETARHRKTDDRCNGNMSRCMPNARCTRPTAKAGGANLWAGQYTPSIGFMALRSGCGSAAITLSRMPQLCVRLRIWFRSAIHSIGRVACLKYGSNPSGGMPRSSFV
eukprot:SAG31_NODE_6298_length_2077_cov_1.649141_2_plen_164_part_00